MSLLEPSAEEKAEAANFLPEAVEENAEENVDADRSVDSKEEAVEAKPDEVAEEKGEGTDEVPEQDDDASPSGLEKRIAQLTRQRRDAERKAEVLAARDRQREEELRELKEAVAGLKTEKESTDFVLDENATPEERDAYWQARMQQERDEIRQELRQEMQNFQTNTLLAQEQSKHDGSDNLPSFVELRKTYEDVIVSHPDYEHSRAKIQSSTNPPAEFYNIALEFWKQDNAGVLEERELLARERDASTVATGSTSSRSRGNGQTKLSGDEAKLLKEVFGERVKAEDIEKIRSERGR